MSSNETALRAAILPVILRMLPEWLPEEIKNIDYLSGGYSNRNYAFSRLNKKYVLRIVEDQQPYVDRNAELTWLAELPVDISVKPRAYETGSGCMITPWIDGDLLVDRSESISLESLSSFVGDLHSRLPWPSRQYDIVDLLTSVWDVAPFRIPPKPGVLGPAHNDLNPWNVIITPDRWVALDWEFAGLNDPLFDLVSLHQGLELPVSDLEELSLRFLGNSEAVSERLEPTLRLFWLRELGWAKYQVELGNEREEVVDQVKTATDMLQALNN